MNTEFIAEISSNFNGSLDRCFKFIDTAAEIGCDGVKFQLFKIDEMFSPEILKVSKKHRDRRDWELPYKFIEPISERARNNGLLFSCTPFFLEAVDILEPWVDFYKIASYELLWDELIQKCALKGKRLVLSTGMATMPEIEHAVDVVLDNTEKKPILLHCVSGYPTPKDQVNLSAIESISNATKCCVGWSDHSVSPAVINRAVNKWGANFIEFHLDLDEKGDEYKAGHCWLPNDIKEVISNLREIVDIDGNGEKVPQNAELSDRLWRADPEDGLRPFKEVRSVFKGDFE